MGFNFNLLKFVREIVKFESILAEFKVSFAISIDIFSLLLANMFLSLVAYDNL